jgi:hypothetical protein
MFMKIISGGQSGADQAAWRAAKAFGIATGGWMPRGFLRFPAELFDHGLPTKTGIVGEPSRAAPVP